MARPSGLVWKELEAWGDWAVEYPANDGVVFTYVIQGEPIVEVNDVTRKLIPGDFFMLVHPPVWRLGHGRAAPVKYSPAHPAVARLGDPIGLSIRTVGGRFLLDEVNASLVKALLPPEILIDGSKDGRDRVRLLLELLRDEVSMPKPGGAFAVERLMELLLVEIIRRPFDVQLRSIPPASGLLAGLGDPRLCRALQAIHHDAARHWTIGELAQLSGMSRSSFSFHFARIVGIAPMHYLRNWRVALAKRALIDRRLPIEKVAQLVGYQSASAFSTAFARAVGEAPTTFAERRSLPPRRGQEASEVDGTASK